MDRNNLSGEDLERLSVEEISKLAQSSSSKLDIIQVRGAMHKNTNQINSILSQVQESVAEINEEFSSHLQNEKAWQKRIESALYVTVKNGSTRLRSIAELISEHHELIKEHTQRLTLFSSVSIKDLDGEPKIMAREIFDQHILNQHNPKLKARKILEWWSIVKGFIGMAQAGGLGYLIYYLTK